MKGTTRKIWPPYWSPKKTRCFHWRNCHLIGRQPTVLVTMVTSPHLHCVTESISTCSALSSEVSQSGITKKKGKKFMHSAPKCVSFANFSRIKKDSLKWKPSIHSYSKINSRKINRRVHLSKFPEKTYLEVLTRFSWNRECSLWYIWMWRYNNHYNSTSEIVIVRFTKKIEHSKAIAEERDCDSKKTL